MNANIQYYQKSWTSQSSLSIWTYRMRRMHKKGLKAFDCTLKDLRGNGQLLDRALILLSEEFWQTLLVIPRLTSADELNICPKSLVIWRNVEKLISKTNMRVPLQNNASAESFRKTIAEYWEWEHGNRQIYTMYHIFNNFLLHDINQRRINSKSFPKYRA